MARVRALVLLALTLAALALCACGVGAADISPQYTTASISVKYMPAKFFTAIICTVTPISTCTGQT